MALRSMAGGFELHLPQKLVTDILRQGEGLKGAKITSGILIRSVALAEECKSLEEI